MDKKDRIAKTANKEFLEDELSRVLESSTIPTCVISRDHLIIYWNAAMEALTGTRKKDIIGTNKQWSTFYPAKRQILADLIIDRTPDEVIERMYRGKYKKSSLIDGAYEGSDFFPAMGEKGKWLEYTAAPLKNLRGEIIGALETARDIGEEKEAEQKLRESENSYRTLISNIAGAAYRCALDKHGTMSFLSSGIKDLSGYEASEFLNNAVRSFTSVIHPDDRKKMEDQIDAAIKKKAPYTLEYRIMHRDGSIRWVYEKGQAIYEDCSVKWLDGIIYDIQDQKEVEQRLLESEEKYRTVVEASSQNISIVNKEGVFRFMNVAAAKALKGRPGDLIGKTMHELFPKETADSHMRAIGAAINSGTFIKAESSDVMRGERRWYDTSIQPLKNGSGEYDSALIIANDITKRKLFEEEIKSLKEFSENIVESTPVGIIVVDREKRITACNKAEENLFGAGKKDLMGKLLYRDYLGNISDAMEPQLDNTLKTGKTAKRPGVEYRDESGRNSILDISISPLFSGTDITGAVITTDDVTEKKKLKERVRLLEKKELPLTDKDKLVLHGLIAHPDLNDMELARRVHMKRSTLTGIKNKLARTGFYSTVMVPNLPLLGYELLIFNYGNFAPPTGKENENLALREELCQPESIRIISTGIEYLSICVSKNMTEYRAKRDPIEAAYEQEGILKDGHTIYFPFELCTIKNLFDYGPSLGAWFHLKSGSRTENSSSWKSGKARKLTENESLLLYAFIKNPGLSDKEIADQTGLNKVTVGHTRKRLLEEDFIQTLRIPDLSKLGCELMLLLHMKFNPAIKTEERESIMAAQLPESATYISDMREAVSITPCRDYTECKTIVEKYMRVQEKNRIFLHDPETLLIPMKKILHNRTEFAPLVKKAMNLQVDF